MDTFSMEYFVLALAFFFLLFCQTSITVNKKNENDRSSEELFVTDCKVQILYIELYKHIYF